MKRESFNHRELCGHCEDIETSLRRGGFAWITGKTETLFYFGVKWDGENFRRFEFDVLPNDVDLTSHFALGEVYIPAVSLPRQVYYLTTKYLGISRGQGEQLYYCEVISGGDVRFSSIGRVKEHLSAEEIARLTDHAAGTRNHRLINAFYRAQDESDKYPINGKFNATERAIVNIRHWGLPIYGLEYCYALEHETSRLVNKLT